MPDPEEASKPELPEATRNMMEQVEVRATRMIRGRKRRYRNFWRPVAVIGLIGWTVVVPMLAGIAVGTWIDRTWPSRFSWTLMLLVAGLGIGCISAWDRIKDEQKDR